MQYPELWEVTKAGFDSALLETFECSGKLPLINFIKTYKVPLGLYVLEDDLIHLAEALRDSTDPDGRVLRRCITASCTTASMFKDLTKKSQYVLFVAAINERLKQLDFNDFDEVALSDFPVVMAQEVQSLKESGFDAYETRTSWIEFMGSKVKVELSDLDDEWRVRREALLKTLAVSSNSIRRLPWEVALHGDQSIAGIRQTVSLSDKITEPYVNVREVMFSIMGDVRTLAEMLKILTSNEKLLYQSDRTCSVLELGYLKNHAEQDLLQSCHCACLAALPNEGSLISMADSQNLLSKVCTSKVVTILGTTAYGEVSGLHRIVAGLAKGSAPQAVEITRMSGFYKVCMKRMTYFYTCEVPCTTDANYPFSDATQTLGGPMALEHSVGKLAGSAKGGQDIALPEIHQLRLFAWSFSQADRDFVEQRYQESLRSTQKGLAMFKTITDGDTAKGPALVTGASSASSSSSATTGLAMATVSGLQPLLKKQKKDGKDVKEEVSKSQMMKFFGATVTG